MSSLRAYPLSQPEPEAFASSVGESLNSERSG